MHREIERLMGLGWEPPSISDEGIRIVRPSMLQNISYPSEGLELLALENGSGFWFEHRTRAVAQLLAQLRVSSMWEVGSGTGAMASQLSPPLTEVVTVEPLIEGAQSAATRGLTAICGTFEELQLPRESLKCIGAFDVIEHMPRTETFLLEAHRVLTPGGFLIVTVPAFTWLWGEEDDIAGHKRRYTKAHLVAQSADSGFAPVSIQYLYASLVIPAAVTRALPYRLGIRRGQTEVLRRMRSQLVTPKIIDRTARAILSMEDAIAGKFAMPFGLSILGAFRRV